MQTYPALLTVTTTSKDKAKKQKRDTLYTGVTGGMTEGLLAEDQAQPGDDFFTDRGRLGE
jgi:hypothetical protein